MAKMEMTLSILLAMISVAIVEGRRPPVTPVETLQNTNTVSIPETVGAWV